MNHILPYSRNFELDAAHEDINSQQNNSACSDFSSFVHFFNTHREK